MEGKEHVKLLAPEEGGYFEDSEAAGRMSASTKLRHNYQFSHENL
jgi:hypothetical protein